MKSPPDLLPALKDLAQAVANGELFPVVTVGGSEEYLIQHARKLLLQHLLIGPAAEFDFVQLDAKSTDGATLWKQLTALPMFGARRVIEFFNPAGIRDGETQLALENYLQRPSPSTSLILVQPLTRKPSKRDASGPSKFPAYLFFPLKSPDRARFVHGFLRARGKSIEDAACDYLVESSSDQLQDIASKLEHLELYAGDEKTVSLQMAMRATGSSSEVNIFEFEDAIMAGNASRVLREARLLLESGLEAVVLLARLRNLALRLWVISGTVGRPGQEELIRKTLGGQVFKSKQFISASRRLGREQLANLLLNILQIEMNLKSKSADARYQIYDWLWKICGQELLHARGTSSGHQEYVR